MCGLSREGTVVVSGSLSPSTATCKLVKAGGSLVDSALSPLAGPEDIYLMEELQSHERGRPQRAREDAG